MGQTVPRETWRQYAYRRFIERFWFAWVNRCWRCLWRPFHD